MIARKGRAFLALSFVALASAVTAGLALAGGSASIFSPWVPTSGSSTQVEPLGFAGAAGFQDVQVRNAIVSTKVTASTVYAPASASLVLGANNGTQVTLTSGGGMQVGSPTGGDKGAGTLNATAVYVNGTAVSTVAATFSVHASSTGTTTIDTTATVWPCDTTSASFTITVPTAVSANGTTYIIKKTSSDANILTIGTTSSQTIDGATTKTVTTQWQSYSLVSDGSNWLIY